MIASLRVKVVPGSSGSQIVGWLGESLKVRVTANAKKGKANEAVIALLAGALQIPKRAINIAAGRSSLKKTITISGLSDSEIRSRLSLRDA